MIDPLDQAVGGDVSRETRATLEAYVKILIEENRRQNLIGRATEEDVWARHIVDSAQLFPLLSRSGTVADIGSGAGLPGLVLAILGVREVALVEPRKLRAQFLEGVVDRLELANVRVVPARAQSAMGQYDAITARAVASAVELIGITRHLAHRTTKYVLMKGRRAQTELEAVERAWQGDFRLVPSLTDAEAAILVGERIRPKGKA